MDPCRSNALIHQLFVRQEYDDCMKLVAGVLEESGHKCEYAIYVKALIERQRGHIAESLRLFQQATALNPHNVLNLKQVGRSLALLGKHWQAIEVYDEAQKLAASDWELWHAKGLCYAHLPDGGDQALECFGYAVAIQPNDASYMRIGQLHAAREHWESAIATFGEALQHSPESSELLTALGLLLLRAGDGQRAFDYLGTSLLHDPKGARAILAAGSIIQDHADYDAALVKYRVAAAVEPNCAQLWNNVGMAFFGKQRYIAAIACLKKALYLGPFEWLIAHNLGLAHLATDQAASAFHYLSAAVNLNPGFAPSYMLLGVALERLEDPDNARAAYERSLALDPQEPLAHLNYGVMLQKHGDSGGAAAQLAAYRSLAAAAGGGGGGGDAGAGGGDSEAAEAAEELCRALAAAGVSV